MIFKKYDYDFDSFSESFRNKVLGNGSFVRISEVLDSLSKYKFPIRILWRLITL